MELEADIFRLFYSDFFQTFFRLVAALFRANFFGKGWREVPAGVFRVSGDVQLESTRLVGDLNVKGALNVNNGQLFVNANGIGIGTTSPLAAFDYRRVVGDFLGRTLLHVSSRRFETSQSAGKSRLFEPGEGWPRAPLPDGSGPDERGRRLDRPVPKVLGRTARFSGRIHRADATGRLR